MSEAMSDPQVRQLVETIQRLEMLKAEAKEVARDYRERIEVIEAEVSTVAEQIRSGQRRLFGAEDPDTAAAGPDGRLEGEGVETTMTLNVPGMAPVTASLDDFKRATNTLKRRARA